MNIPMKYEDVVAKLADATDTIEYMRKERVCAEEREAALREELDAESRGADRAAESLLQWRRDCLDLQQRLTVAEQKLGDAYEWGYGDGQQSPNGYSDKEDRDKCVAELLKQAADCEHGYSNQTGCPVCQGIKP